MSRVSPLSGFKGVETVPLHCIVHSVKKGDVNYSVLEDPGR